MASTLALVSTIMFYIVSSLSMVLANKFILMNNPAPITFLTLQLFVATILFLILRLLPTKSKNLQFQLPAIPSKTYCVALGPLLLLNLLGLSANTYTLLLLPASFYQIARGLVLPLTLITSAMLLPPSPSTRPTQNLVLACIVITVGFLVGVSPTITNPKAALKGPNALSPLGILAGLISSLSSSLHVVVIKQLTDSKHLSLPLLDFSYYSNTMTAVTLVPFIFITGEYGSFIKWFYDEKTAPKDIRNFIVGTLVTGVIGLAISLSSLISVKITSPITHMVISAVRGVVQAAVAAWLFKELIDEIRLISIAVILGGSLWYTWLKANPPPSQQHGHQRSESITALPLMRRKDEDTEAGAPSGAPGTYERVPDEDPDREFAREARKD